MTYWAALWQLRHEEQKQAQQDAKKQAEQERRSSAAADVSRKRQTWGKKRG